MSQPQGNLKREFCVYIADHDQEAKKGLADDDYNVPISVQIEGLAKSRSAEAGSNSSVHEASMRLLTYSSHESLADHGCFRCSQLQHLASTPVKRKEQYFQLFALSTLMNSSSFH